MTAISSRIAEPISGPMPDLAYEIGHGRNAVNVLLVALRAFDTFGEITVLAIAATGVASLIFGTGSVYRDSRRHVLSAAVPRWLSSSVNSETAQNRHMMVDAATRILFPSMNCMSRPSRDFHCCANVQEIRRRGFPLFKAIAPPMRNMRVPIASQSFTPAPPVSGSVPVLTFARSMVTRSSTASNATTGKESCVAAPSVS